MISIKQVSELLDTSKIHFQSNTKVRKPDVIVDYNRNMGGVNNLSRVIIRTTFKKMVETNRTGSLVNYSSKLEFIMHLLFSKIVIKIRN